MSEPRRRSRVVAAAAFWVALSLATSGQYYLNRQFYSERAVWWFGFLTQGAGYYVWGLATPLIWRVGRRFPLSPATWRAVMAHTATFAGCALVHSVYLTSVRWLFIRQGWDIGSVPDAAPWSVLLARSLTGYAILAGLMYTAITAAGLFLGAQQTLRERDVRQLRLESELNSARLHALRLQLNPHFLFNALNTISNLVRQGSSAVAVKMLARLSDLLRHALDETVPDLVTLRDELALVDRYLEIEQLRFHDRLAVRMDVEPGALDLLVPSFVLQSLVENAIRHGITPQVRGGTVTIEARRAGTDLRLAVLDDGIGLGPDWQARVRTGVGFRNTQSRLKHLYGDGEYLTVESDPGQGTSIRIVLPAVESDVTHTREMAQPAAGGRNTS